jgi:hypothetical protein
LGGSSGPLATTQAWLVTGPESLEEHQFFEEKTLFSDFYELAEFFTNLPVP